MALILWDIDGTLLDTDGAGRRSLLVALDSVFGIDGTMEGINMKGQTDEYIVSALFRKYRLQMDYSSNQAFVDAYLSTLPVMLKARQFRLLQGVPEVLDFCHTRDGHVCGLITGNMQRAAWIKLAFGDIDHYFEFGAFGDDHRDRNELARLARERALRRHPEVSDDPVIVVGDTPLDVECARSIGARSIAVATGFSTRLDLVRARADVVLDDLSNTESFRDLISSF